MAKSSKKPENPKDERPEEQLENILKQLQENLGVDIESNNVKLVKVGSNEKISNNPFLNIILLLLINLTLFISLSGYISWADFDNVWYFVLFIGIFTLLEMILKYGVSKFFPKLVFMSLGFVFTLFTIITFIICCFLVPGFNLKSSGGAILFLFSFLIIRFIIKNLIFKNQVLKTIKRIKKG